MRPGYKHTPVGMIPVEWEVKLVCDLGHIKTGPFGTLLKADEYSGTEGVPLISVGEIGLGIFKVTEHTPRVPKKVITRLPQYVLRCGDIVFGRKGAVERSALVTQKEDGWFLGSDGIGIRPQRFCFPPYMAYQFQRHEVQTWLIQNATGTTMPSLNQAILGRVQIPYAPLPEQQAIADSLSDVDALLGVLDRLIAKKRDLKQAAMQQLLTGQARLPGFHGEWEVKRLGDVAHIKTGSRNNEDKVDDGQYPFYVRSEFVESINSYSHDCEAILVPGEGRIGSIFHYVHGRFDLHQRVYAITQFKPDTFGRFIHFYLSKNFGAWAMQNTVKATVDSLRLPTFVTFVMLLPPTLEEQTAIAEVLGDMDTELSALEQRRSKTRDLKQAMMQELLTGRTRLV